MEQLQHQLNGGLGQSRHETMTAISLWKLIALKLALITSIFQPNSAKSQEIAEKPKKEKPNYNVPLTEAPSNSKSLRLITGHTSSTLPKGTFEFVIQHRFGELNEGAENLFGLDNFNSVRLGFDWALGNRITIGAGRSSRGKMFNSYFKWRMIGSPRTKFNLTYLANTDIDGRKTSDWGVSPFFFSHRLAYTHQLIFSQQFGEKLVIGVAPTLVHFNLVDLNNQSNDIPYVNAYVRRTLSPKMALTFEGSTLINGIVNTPEKSNPTLGFGFEYFTPKHTFQINLTNSRSLYESGFLTQNPTSTSMNQFCLGFNLIRRW
jgi:hypothetical protein